MFKQSNQNSFFGHYLYDQVIPANHFLRKVNETVDFSFVNELCLDVYDNLGSVGNRPYEPVMLFKILFLSFLYDVSAREMEEQINDRLSFKWFLNLAVNDPSPDHSTLTYFVERIEVDKFEKIFNRIVAQAKTKGLIHERLKIIDSTAIKAKDAKQFYGYKQHIIIDGDSEIIEAVYVTAGNVKDEQIVEPLLDNATLAADGRKKTKILTDKGYDTNANHQLIENRYRSKSFIMIKKNRIVDKLVKLMKSKIYKQTTKERYKRGKKVR